MSRQSKMIACLISTFIIAVAFGYSYYFVIGSYASTQFTIVQEANIDDYSIKLKGMTINSASGFSGYKLIYKDKTLYIKLKYSIVSPFNPSGDFSIDEGGYFEGVEKAYLQGPQENDLKLIWSK